MIDTMTATAFEILDAYADDLSWCDTEESRIIVEHYWKGIIKVWERNHGMTIKEGEARGI